MFIQILLLEVMDDYKRNYKILVVVIVIVDLVLMGLIVMRVILKKVLVI